jgi:hypothetical protein
MHVEWKGNNSARERSENACGVERKLQRGKGKKMWSACGVKKYTLQFSDRKVRICMWSKKDKFQRGKGKKMHVEWKGNNSARER